jgi:hypothetical protein
MKLVLKFVLGLFWEEDETVLLLFIVVVAVHRVVAHRYC